MTAGMWVRVRLSREGAGTGCSGEVVKTLAWGGGVGVGIQGRAAAEWTAKNPEGLTSKAADLLLEWGEGKALIVLSALLYTAAERRHMERRRSVCWAFI